jgi:endonuclease/exonuclease/phosphatase family metal-dependent hydrolase
VYVGFVALGVLTWNLKHGRAVPSAGRDLFEEFCAALAGWDWEVALLQEVPPWWPQRLAARLGAEQRMVLTSRNFALVLRRWVAERWPDVIKSNGGGCNAILVRNTTITAHRTRRLRLWPERRWLHAVLADGVWIANLHCQGTMQEALRARRTVLDWSAGDSVVLGGDFNLRQVRLEGFAWAGGSGVDHVLVHGLAPGTEVWVPARGHLSDHAPVLVRVG